MNLFLILYVSGHIGGVIGPLPYDMSQCLAVAAEMAGKRDAALADNVNRKTGQQFTADERKTVETMSFSCEMHSVRPSLGMEV